MKAYILIILVSLLPLNTYAENQEKKINIGIGTYALKISYDTSKVPFDDDLTGAGISASYAFSDQFAIRGEYYLIDHKSFSSIDNRGTDLVAYVGTGLTTYGPKAYIGGGIFLETWQLSGNEADFNGLQVNGGVGYNWDQVALDFIVGYRDPDDYDDFKSINGGTRAVTISLIVSARY